MAPLHLAQSLGHARVKARGVIGRIGGILWLHAQGVGVCCTMTVVNIDPGVAAPLPAAGCRGNCWRDTGGRSGLLAGQRLLEGLSLLIHNWLSNARISEQQCCMEEFLTLKAVRAES